ncbi:MAG TPA: DNA-processing protein DprA [Paenalcaligenes sp.]|nr:DNA-processing protein DprA [Paenalcaligenes sp.]
MTQATASADELRAWLKLTMTPKLGTAQAMLLLSEFGLPQQILDHSLSQLSRYVSMEVAQALKADLDEQSHQLIEHTLQWVQAEDQYIITIADELYPKDLYNLHQPPLLLYAKGDLQMLQRPTLAIVGARNATATGKRDAHEFAHFLSARGWCICSGLAAGIDTAAHQGALSAPQPHGSTIAVLATGMDIVYPAANRNLAHQIADQGLLLSEYALNQRARTFHFPMRNRLVAALSRGTLVVEAAQRSGSLITAKLATEMGREVFAIPGSIHSPLSRGCHALIKQGAKLVESGADILDELQQRGQNPAEPSTPPALQAAVEKQQEKTTQTTTVDPVENTTENHGAASNDTALPELWLEYPLLQEMGFEPMSFDQLLQLTPDKDINSLSVQLTELELLGHIERLPGGYYQQSSALDNE